MVKYPIVGEGTGSGMLTTSGLFGVEIKRRQIFGISSLRKSLHELMRCVNSSLCCKDSRLWTVNCDTSLRSGSSELTRESVFE